MTKITFDYTDSYQKPSRGSLAFMAHRRHASNETEVLPKPFMVPLVNGKADVNLEPNAESWVWMVTENFGGSSGSELNTYFITVPDKDDEIPFNTITKINPSTLPAPYDAVEPAWWAEIKEFKSVVGETLTEAEKALETAETSLSDGEQYRDEARKSASNAKAYAKESTESAYKSKDYRDQSEEAAIEAERQADRAASGPESAAGRAESAADDAEKYRDESKEYRDSAQSSANDARDDAQSANNSASSASSDANDASNARDDARDYRDKAKEYRDDILAEPEQLEDRVKVYRDETLEYSETAKDHRDKAQGYRDSAKEYRDTTETFRSDSKEYRDETQTLHDGVEEKISEALEGITNPDDHGEWVKASLKNDYEHGSAAELQSRILSTGDLQINGCVTGGDRGSNVDVVDKLHPDFTASYTTRIVASTAGGTVSFQINEGGSRLRMMTGDPGSSAIWLNSIIPG